MTKASTATCPWRDRKSFAKIKAVIDMPDLIETQQRSYKEFLQSDVLPSQRKMMGLQEAFSSIFPIKGRDNSTLEFVCFSLGRPKYDMMECIDRGMTYSAPLRIKVRLVVRGGEKRRKNRRKSLIFVRRIFI